MKEIALGHSPPKLHFHNVEYQIKEEFYELMGSSTFINQKTPVGADYIILTNKTFYWCNKELSGTYIAKYVMDNVPNKITGQKEILNVLEMAASKDSASIELGKKLILRCDFKNKIFTEDLIRSAFSGEYYKTSLLAEFYYYLLCYNTEALSP